MAAQRHGVSYLAVLEANGLDKDSVLQPGQTLVIPVETAAAEQPSDESDSHLVAKGESLWEIARSHGVAVSALAAENGIDPDRVLRIGQRVRIPAGGGETHAAAAEDSAEGSGVETYVVRPGDSLWELARVWDTSVRAVAAVNGLNPYAVLPVGRTLEVPSDAETASAAEPTPQYYVVQKGDTLWEIARWHGTSVSALAQVNGLDADRFLRVGSRLQLPAGSQHVQGGQHRFVQTAMQYRGVPYRWGGMTSRGLDCSGLVARVLRAHGIDAPHYSKALYGLGRPVSRSNLRPGDLVFFHTTRPGISHVGIYIGHGKFIHASSSKGRVRVDSLRSGYYDRRLVGARRVQ